MKKLYKLVVLLTMISVFQDIYAQKTLKLQVYRVRQTCNTDCDGVLTDSDFQWRWTDSTGGQIGCQYYDGNNGAINTANIDNVDIALFGTKIIAS